MATDYDKPRTVDTDDAPEQSVAALKAASVESGANLGDETDPSEATFDLPDADPTGEDLTTRVVPAQADEFTCTSCYLVHHRNQLADQRRMICNDCIA
jgi:hypothetical protein